MAAIAELRRDRLSLHRRAEAGLDVAAIVCVHGTLTTTARACPGAVRSPVLVCHGALDRTARHPLPAVFAAVLALCGVMAFLTAGHTISRP